MREDGRFETEGIIKTGIVRDHELSKGVYDKWSYIYELEPENNGIKCHVDGNRKEYRQPLRFDLNFQAL